MDDIQIINLYFARDEHAITATDVKYGNLCRSIAKSILALDEDAEECTSDTYLQAWNSIPPQKPSHLGAFLAKITRNLAFNRYRLTHAEKRGAGETALVLDELAECIVGEEGVERRLEMRELSAAIDDFLASLDAKKRRIFVCRYFHNDSIQSIAARFSMKESTVAMTLARTRAKLREHLEKGGFLS